MRQKLKSHLYLIKLKESKQEYTQFIEEFSMLESTCFRKHQIRMKNWASKLK